MALNGEDRKDTATDMVSQLQGVVSEERVHDVQQEVPVRLVREVQHHLSPRLRMALLWR